MGLTNHCGYVIFNHNSQGRKAVITTDKSRNSKTGPVAATYRGKQTCPSDCPAFKACYAKGGYTNLAFDKASIKREISDTVQFTKWIASLPFGQKIRHNVSGDFVKDNATLDRTYIRGFIRAMMKRPDLNSWGYTHAWKKFKSNVFSKLNSANINASCDKISDIKSAKEKGFDTVVIMPQDAKTGMYDGERIVICPNQTNEKVTCEKCMLCARKNRNFTIGFRIHGSFKGNYKFEEKIAIQPIVKEKVAVAA